jgi:hypothetical protein
MGSVSEQYRQASRADFREYVRSKSPTLYELRNWMITRTCQLDSADVFPVLQEHPEWQTREGEGTAGCSLATLVERHLRAWLRRDLDEQWWSILTDQEREEEASEHRGRNEATEGKRARMLAEDA